ncbi:OB-fold nucleic acid binding domain-containing protein, partial [Streptomyces albidoflavus]|nr:DNA polymerase III subunit alpha [Streptomyces albidoflavus]
RGAAAQPTLLGADSAPGARRVPSAGLPDLDETERLSAELGVLGMDASRNLMDDHRDFLEELRVTSARSLRGASHGSTVLVAGAKVATQTPPVRSGRRVVFTTLDDSTGLVDLAFFDDSHEACAHTVFHSWLLLVRGTVQRRGARSLSVVGTAAWNLADLIELRRDQGLEAVAAHLAADPDQSPEAAPGRRIRMSTGYEMNAWADLRPAGPGPDATGTPPAPAGITRPETAGNGRLWHRSQGSAG